MFPEGEEGEDTCRGSPTREGFQHYEDDRNLGRKAEEEGTVRALKKII